jgi:hypothetical protein
MPARVLDIILEYIEVPVATYVCTSVANSILYSI